MREVNFSIPNANKASVGITHALYDRRALDCTSTLPLINSLNNLAYLTTSSGRIRDILTVDGGIERLVCILKEGRSKDMMEMWKWNLAFQCIVNIGVRGSEAVRTRVVEADMVPVIATILDNYFQVMDKHRERVEMENRRKCPFSGSKGFSRSSNRSETHEQRLGRSRRHAPPPIAIPEAREQPEAEDPASETTPTAPTANLSLSSPPDRAAVPRRPTTQQASTSRAPFSTPPTSNNRQPEAPTSGMTLQSNASAAFVRPVRDIDRLPSMVTPVHADLSSQPQSPTTPGAFQRPGSPRASASTARPRRRPSIRHQLSISGSDDDGQIEESVSEESTGAEGEPVVNIQSDIVMQDIGEDDGLMEPQANTLTLNVPDVTSTDDETFNITHRSTGDGSTVNSATPTQAQMNHPPTQLPPPVNAVNATPPALQAPGWYPARGLPLDRPGNLLAAMPREEDVLMSLQLLAYVSKYCNLRSYFQQSRLVPRLKIGNELKMLDPDYNPATHKPATQEELEDEWDNEFVKKPGEAPFNIFPLIEKFTAKPSARHGNTASPQSGDMQYWAGVVMRNLCRKDDSRGGIRQCAYWQCGKWEEYTRQFAKCRRCRRTKYCSKECQKGAWGSHRFWCVAAEDSKDGEAGSSDRHHHHRHHRHHHHHH